MGLAFASGACEEFTEAVPPEELLETERGAFAAAGRFFVVGNRPEGAGCR